MSDITTGYVETSPRKQRIDAKDNANNKKLREKRVITH